MSDNTRTPLMAGNWKSNLNHVEATGLVQKLAWTLQDKRWDPSKSEVAVFPPFTDLRTVQTLVEGDKLDIGYGAQDVSEHDGGAHTGDVSAAMLAKLACRYVIVGHSERRSEHQETDQVVRTKLEQVLAQQLAPLLCVGEGGETRDAGEHVAHCVGQISAALSGLTPPDLARVVIAYEPVWAIGTGKVATPDDAQEVCGAIRQWLTDTGGAELAGQSRVLYGGSVKADNIVAIMAQPDIDGALVGGASLQVDEFAAICRFYDLVGN